MEQPLEASGVREEAARSRGAAPGRGSGLLGAGEQLARAAEAKFRAMGTLHPEQRWVRSWDLRIGKRGRRAWEDGPWVS